MASTALLGFVFCWEQENRPTGRRRPKLFRSGSPNASAHWQLLYLTVALRLGARLRLSLSCGFTSDGDGVPRSWCPVHWASYGCSFGDGSIICLKHILASAAPNLK